MIISRFVTSAGARIHYLDSGGDDRGAPVVFVPGMTDLAEDYREVLGNFGRRTVVVELRGHGRSSAPREGYGLEQQCDDVGAVVDDITEGPVHLVTFSRGTSYAVGWAVQHGDRVRSLAIGDYVPAEIVPPPGAVERLLDGRWRGRSVRDRLDAAAARRIFAAARQRSFWEPLASLQPALLVVRSRERQLVDDRAWARYARSFPEARLVEFSDSPHDIFRPDRDRYPRLVRDHIEAAEGVSTA
jgi:non-heme chloroperoxidase